ncbi:hypothetical protein GQ600_6664 [Phytophthora cactorum]|nr:hypothetical protein GQ600_6664 [Phytophthora cactorum]
MKQASDDGADEEMCSGSPLFWRRAFFVGRVRRAFSTLYKKRYTVSIQDRNNCRRSQVSRRGTVAELWDEWKFKPSGSGKRTNHNIRSIKCPAKLSANVFTYKKDCDLKVRVNTHFAGHNHVVDKDVYYSYAESRQIRSPGTPRVVTTLIQDSWRKLTNQARIHQPARSKAGKLLPDLTPILRYHTNSATNWITTTTTNSRGVAISKGAVGISPHARLRLDLCSVDKDREVELENQVSGEWKIELNPASRPSVRPKENQASKKARRHKEFEDTKALTKQLDTFGNITLATLRSYIEVKKLSLGKIEPVFSAIRVMHQNAVFGRPKARVEPLWRPTFGTCCLSCWPTSTSLDRPRWLTETWMWISMGRQMTSKCLKMD